MMSSKCRVLLSVVLFSQCAVEVRALEGVRLADAEMERVEYEYDYLMAAYRMIDLAALTSLFAAERSLYALITPGFDPLVQPHGYAIPFDHQNFPTAFADGLIGEWSYGKTPIYTVRVLEHPTTRALLFVNEDGVTFYSVPAPRGYNPHWLAEQRYPGILDGKYTKEWTDYILQWLDPSRIQIIFQLAPTESFYNYLSGKAEAEALAAAEMEELGEGEEGEFLLLRGGGEFAIVEFPLDGGDMVVTWDGETNHYYRIQITTSLIEGDWETIDMMLGEDDVMTWSELVSTNLPAFAFYRVAQLDVATPGDLDGDGMDDVWEMLNGFDPFDPADALLDLNEDGLTVLDAYTHGLDPLEDASDTAGNRDNFTHDPRDQLVGVAPTVGGYSVYIIDLEGNLESCN